MPFRHLTVASLFVFGLAACSDVTTDGFAHEGSDIAADPNVVYGILDNGLRYALRENGTPSNTATLLMHVDTGSLDEREEDRGLAHFLEHMAFNGSTNIPEGEMTKRLERLGLAFGADTNASTGYSDTTYQLELPDVELVDDGLDIMRETASELLFEAGAIERERGVILSEKRARNSPAFRAFEARTEFLLGDSLYARRSPIGTEDTIKSVERDDFRRFYKGYYRPENTFLVIVGDLEASQAEALITAEFADWQGRGDALKSAEPADLPARGKEAEIFVDPEVTTAISVVVPTETDLRDDSAQVRKERLIRQLGNRMLNRRLARLSRAGNAAFNSAGVGTSNVFEIGAASTLSVSSEVGRWDTALGAAGTELRRALEYGFTQDELDEQLANLRNSLEVAVQTAPTRRTPNLARQILNSFTSETVLSAPEDTLERFVANASDLTLEAVMQSFRQNWSDLDAPLIYMNSPVEIEGGDGALLGAWADVLARQIDEGSPVLREEFAYRDWGAPGDIVEREYDAELDYYRIRFENNVRLNMKTTDFERDTIRISATVDGGTHALADPIAGLQIILDTALSAGGLDAHSNDELSSILAGRTVGATVGIAEERATISGATVGRDLSLQLDLMAAKLLHQGYREEAKLNIDKSIRTFLPTLDSTPGGVAARDLGRIAASGDPRFGIPGEETLLSLSLDQAEAVAEPILQSGPIEIGIVGDVDVETAIAEVARTFGALPTRDDEAVDVPASARKLSFPDGTAVELTHAGEPDTALYTILWPAFDGADVIRARQAGILSAILRLRLTEALREEDGKSYSPGASSYLPRAYDDYGYLSATVNADPEDVGDIADRIDAIAADLAGGNITQDEFDRAIRPVRERIEESLETNGYWMSVIGRAQRSPEEIVRHRSRARDYAQMTPDDLKPMAADIFKADDALRVSIIPETPDSPPG